MAAQKTDDTAHPPSPQDCPKSLGFFGVTKATFKEWSDDNASTLAAALTYYAIFSIGPLLIISIAIISLIFGQKAANDQIRPQLAQFVGDKGAAALQDIIHHANISPSFSFAGMISIVLLIYAATNVFASLQSSLNIVFDVEPKPGRGIWAIIRDRGMTFLMVLVLGAFMLASIVLNTMLASFTKWGVDQLFPNHPGAGAFMLQAVSFVVSAIVFTGLFALLFKYLPDVKIHWKDTLIGAAATAIFFTLARIGLGYYLARGSTSGPFGAAGSLVIVLLFIYYSAQVMFLGAEFTQIWSCRSGDPIVPADNAVFLNRKFEARNCTGDKPENPAAEPRKGGAGRWWQGQSVAGRGNTEKVERSSGEGGRRPAEDDVHPSLKLTEGYPASQYHPPMT